MLLLLPPSLLSVGLVEPSHFFGLDRYLICPLDSRRPAIRLSMVFSFAVLHGKRATASTRIPDSFRPNNSLFFASSLAIRLCVCL